MDIQAAFRDGYSKEEVMAELGRRTGMNYQQALKDGHSPDDVLGELNKRDSGGTKPDDSITHDEVPGQKTWGEAISEGAKRLIPSIYSDFLEPAVKGLISPSPMISKLTQDPGTGELFMKPPEISTMDMLRGVGKEYGETYGGIENLKETISKHPGKIIGDISTLAISGAKGAQMAGLSKLAKAMEVTADVTNPLGLAGKGAEAIRKGISATELPESLYARTMKIPPGSLREEGRERVLKTLVREEGLPLGKNTVDKMNVTIKELDTDIGNVIKNVSKQGADIDINTVMNGLENLKKNYRNRPDPQAYYDAIDAAKQEYSNHAFVNQGRISLADAHDLKKGTYAEIQDYYMKQQKPETGRIGVKNDIDAVAKAEAAKVLREEVLNHPGVPSVVKEQMSKEAGLMNARKWVERATNRGGNLDPVSLSGFLFGIMVEKGMPATAAWRIATSQPVMSRIAIGLAGGSETLKAMGKVTKPAINIGYLEEKASPEDILKTRGY